MKSKRHETIRGVLISQQREDTSLRKCSKTSVRGTERNWTREAVSVCTGAHYIEDAANKVERASITWLSWRD